MPARGLPERVVSARSAAGSKVSNTGISSLLEMERLVGQRQVALLDDPKAISLEYLFEQVAEPAGCRWKTFHGSVAVFDRLDPDQRRALVKLFMDVVRIGGGHRQRRRAWAQAVERVILGR